ncbi:MoaD/ThiS family protein [Ramlibacter sp. AN1015]|uniref:MoaD/ThiS family protein n=1 Tax=Ramlibacter sp. AN1015 TaxID=3133428 RepID=UPI0030C4F3AD
MTPEATGGARVTLAVRYFASIREDVGRSGESLETAAGTLGALREELIARGEPYAHALARGRALRMALDQVMADEATPLRQGAEVAFFPPVTGG